jgi:hypothetical protein
MESRRNMEHIWAILSLRTAKRRDQKRLAFCFSINELPILGLGCLGLIQLLHQARFSPRRIVFLDDTFLCGGIKCTHGCADVLFAIRFFCGDSGNCLFHLRPGGCTDHSVSRAAFCALPYCFFSSMFVGQSSPPNIISAIIYTRKAFLTNHLGR